MKITILGMGHGGTTMAADLSKKGHQVTMVKTSNSLHNEHYEYLSIKKEILLCENKITEQIPIFNVTNNLEDGINNADLIIIYIQTNYHETLIKKLVPLLQGNETIMLEPGYMSSAFFLKHWPKNKKFDLTIIEAESSPIDCRIISLGKVEVLFRNIMNFFGIYPKKQRSHACQVIDKLDYPFDLRNSIIETALHNPNLIVHTIGGIMSIPRIEYTKGEYWMYKEVFTPTIWNLINALDNEKMNILAKCGYDRITYLEACASRNSAEINIEPKKVFDYYANNNSPKGPDSPYSRFITEDVPQGLVLLESLGKELQIETPTTTALIDLASALLKSSSFRDEGRTLKTLNLQDMLSSIE
jgi:opine dehydrogenase